MLPSNYKPDPLLPEDLESKRQASVLWLGERWLLHPANGPAKGNYSYDGWQRHQKGKTK